MKVEMKDLEKELKIKVGDILVYKDNSNGLKHYLITCANASTETLNSTDSYILQNLNGVSVWLDKGNSRIEIIKMVEEGKFTHYSQDEFKFTVTKIN